MLRYSVIIPERDAGAELVRQVPRLCALFDRLKHPYEVLCVDDGSAAETQRLLRGLLKAQPALRLWQLETPSGASVALSVGITAARGEVVVAIEAGERYPVDQIPLLLSRLARLDLVCARRRLHGWNKFSDRLARIPRALLFGLEVRQPDRLFRAARQEAIAGIGLGPGMRRYLPWLVARRGFRVGDVIVNESAQGRPIPDARPNPRDLLAAWWACRRWRDAENRQGALQRLRDAVQPAALQAGRPWSSAVKIVESEGAREVFVSQLDPYFLRSKAA